jgi:hypothetical protein
MGGRKWVIEYATVRPLILLDGGMGAVALGASLADSGMTFGSVKGLNASASATHDFGGLRELDRREK